MKRMFLCAALALPLAAHAATTDYPDTVVVSGSRTPSTLGKVGSSVTVIDRSTLDFRQANFAVDLLRYVPGITVSNAGGVGKQTQLRMRGAEGNHVMVMIDGVEANDLAGNDEFEFANLSSADIERIEVVRGPQSSLWGSDALAGVINIITRKDDGPFHAEAALDGGSFGTNQQRASVGMRNGRGRVRIGVNRISTAGANIARQGHEDDGYHAVTSDLSGALTLNEALELSLTARNVDTHNQVDSDFITGLPVDTPGRANTEQRYVGSHAKLALLGGHWLQQLDGNWTSTSSDNEDPAVGQDSSNDTDRYEFTYQSTALFALEQVVPSQHSMTVAVDHERDEFVQRGPVSPFGDPNQRRHMDTTGLVGEYRIDLPLDVGLSGSVRHDFNSDFRDITTYRAAAAWRYAPTGTAFNLAYGTGQKAPTFIERFGFSSGGQFGPSFIGNSSFKPEHSRGWEVGVSQALWEERVRVNVTYFNERLKDEIFGFLVDASGTTATAVNQDGTSRRDGVELSFNARLGLGLRLTGGYTYLDATEIDRVTGMRKDEVRRPHHQVNGSLDWSGINDRLRASAYFTHSGRQDDLGFFAPTFQQRRVGMDSFTTLGTTVSYDLSRALQVHARVENMLDDRHEEVLGYRVPGIGVYAGLKFAFDVP
ncbi:MAG: TonB-dependent receptor [Proteobacteria bacterium]|nr:TonB-dependent receptor [Pseudomonadota bacterium]